jgi:hypothetical protein
MVMAIKSIKSDLPSGLGMNFHNFDDGKDINFSGQGTTTTSTWVPYQNPALGRAKQIRIQIVNERNNQHVDSEFYLWDDNYKLVCDTPNGMDTILSVSGDRDIKITVTPTGVQASLY